MSSFLTNAMLAFVEKVQKTILWQSIEADVNLGSSVIVAHMCTSIWECVF